MNTFGNNNIPSSKKDDDLLTEVTKNVVTYLKDTILFNLPDTWNIEYGSNTLSFNDIRNSFISNGIPENIVNKYYGQSSSIKTDAHIIYLTMYDGINITKFPIFMGEMKKQGTNDRRLAEGLKKQAIGNAAGDRVAKNFLIASDYCYSCDKEIFPYNVFLHGCDFDENVITTTLKAKVEPLFGTLNTINPFFDKIMIMYNSSKKGGSCFYQKDDFTYQQLYDICVECCTICISHYIAKYSK